MMASSRDGSRPQTSPSTAPESRLHLPGISKNAVGGIGEERREAPPDHKKETTRGCFLTDGDINLAILDFKNDAAAGAERGRGWSGLHHIGFQVENLEASADKLKAAGAPR